MNRLCDVQLGSVILYTLNDLLDDNEFCSLFNYSLRYALTSTQIASISDGLRLQNHGGHTIRKKSETKQSDIRLVTIRLLQT